MILALAYVFLSAKPISVRRLFLLYVLSFAAADWLLAVFGAEDATKLASQIATVVTLVVWSYPLLRFVHGVFRGHASFEAFEHVSIGVQATYGFAATIALAACVKAIVGPLDMLTFAALSGIVALGVTGGIAGAFWSQYLARHTSSGSARDRRWGPRQAAIR